MQRDAVFPGCLQLTEIICRGSSKYPYARLLAANPAGLGGVRRSLGATPDGVWPYGILRRSGERIGRVS